MGTLKLRILLGLVFVMIVALVSLAIRFRATPVVPEVEIPPGSPIGPVAIGTPLPEESPSPSPITSSFVGQVDLIVPVAGVRPDQLMDTFADARSEGRSHDAIDIPAAAETPVLAAADGKIVKLFQSDRGGTTIYQLSSNQELVFYYAHLSRYADGLAEGDVVRQGQVIAYVGDTGNAGAGNYHLHFSIAAVADPKRHWEGTNINPYPLLQNRAR
jgi:peptidoglycan LD-endopeptidase LytH